MTKATQLSIALGSMIFVYGIFLFGMIPVPEIIQDKILPVLPFWFLMSFGSYSLGSLGWGLITFKDKPEAYNKLLQEIEEAQVELAAMGITIDEDGEGSSNMA